MAALQSQERPGGGLVLATPTANRLRSLASLPIWLGVLGAVLLTGRFEGLLSVIGIYAGLQVFSALWRLTVATRVQVNPGARTISVTMSLLGVPLSVNLVGYNDISRILVASPTSPSRAAQARPRMWQLFAVPKQGTMIRLNWDGTREEMLALGQRISNLTRIPFVDEMAPQPAPEATPQPRGWPESSFGGGTPINTLPVDSPSREHVEWEQEAREDTATRPLEVRTPAGARKGTRTRAVVGTTAPANVSAGQPVSLAGSMAVGISGLPTAALAPSELQRPLMGTGQALQPLALSLGPALFGIVTPVLASTPATAVLSPGSAPALSYGATPALSSATAAVMPSPMDVVSPGGGVRAIPSQGTISAAQDEAARSEIRQSAAADLYSRTDFSQLEAAIHQDPTDARAWAELGQRYQDRRQWARARDAYLELVKFDPLNANAQNELGTVYFMLGDANNARASFNRASALDPFSLPPRFNLALLLIRLGQGSTARAVLDEAMQYARDDGQRRAIESARRGMSPSLFHSRA